MIVAIVAVVMIGLIYSLHLFYSSGSAEEGIVVCNPENQNECLWQDHMHALVITSVNGLGPNLPLEKGDLNDVHTHEERNVIHWHSSLPYDPVAKRVLDTSVFKVSHAFESIGWQLPEDGILFVKKENGNWEHIAEYGDYTWSDHDILYIANDGRTEEQIMNYLQKADIKLPYLGAG